MSTIFSRRRMALGFALMLLLTLSSGVTIAAGTTERVSVSSTGVEGNGPSGVASISASGQYVAFVSIASNLVPGDTNGVADIFVHNRVAGTTEILDLGARGAQDYVDLDVIWPLSITSNGRYVAFFSAADDLVAGDTNETFDIFVHDRNTGTTERVSVASGGAEANGMSYNATISPDGRYIVFTSMASNLVPGDTNDALDVFMHDLTTGDTERVSLGDGSVQANAPSAEGSISDDGRYVAFTSEASNLVTETVFDGQNVYVHDRDTGDTVLANIRSDGTPGNGEADNPVMSGNGLYVAFVSEAENFLDNETTLFPHHVYLHDLADGSTELVSREYDGIAGPGAHDIPAISADGRFVTFDSNVDYIVPNDTNGDSDVFIRDTVAGTTERVSVSSAGVEGSDWSYAATISADGRFVAFQSLATNLVPGDTNAPGSDIFVHDRQAAVSTPGVNAGDDAFVILGDPFIQSGVFADPDSSTWTATVDYGEGDSPQPLTLNPDHTFQLNHTYQDTDEFTVTVEICDDDGNCGSDTIEVEVLETSLRVFAGGNEAAFAGEPYSLEDVSFTDPFNLDSHTATIDWGDSSAVEAGGVYQVADEVYGTHTYTQVGNFAVLICVQDNVSLEACGDFTVFVTDPNNTAPIVDAGGDATANEGASFTRSGSFTDSDTSTTWTATVDYGDIFGEKALALNSDKTFDLNHVYLDDGSYTVTVEVCDDVDACGADSFVVEVSNVAPTVNAGGDQAIGAGGAVSLQPATFTDPGADIHTATIDWGDGSPVESGAVDQSENTVSGSHSYPQTGEYTVEICVTDDNGVETCDTFLVTVTDQGANQPPAVDAGSDQAAGVGAVVSLAPATFTDPDATDTHTATIDWGDGSPDAAGSVDQTAHTVSGSHTYASAGQYTVAVCVTDSASAEDCDTLQVTVTDQGANQPPIVDLGDAVAIADEGALFTRNGSFADPDSSSWTATVDYGDGGGPVTLPLTGMSYTLSHTYADNGSYSVEVCVTDDGSATGCDTLPVTINNVPPTVDAGNDQTVEPGETVSLDPSTFSDPGASDTHTATIDWGDGSGIESGVVNQAAGTVSGSHSYTATGEYTVEICVTDDDGSEMCDTFQATVTDQPVNGAPSVTAAGDASLDEGSPFTGNGSFTDPDSSSWTATVDYGDGGGQANLSLAGMSFALNHTYADNGSYTVEVCVTDDGSETGCDTLTVTVNNVPPDVSAGPNQTVAAGGSMNLGPAAFDDPGELDTHTATIDWGDGSPVESGTVNQAANTVSGSHTYAATGQFTVNVCVSDDAGAEQCDGFLVTVQDVSETIDLCVNRYNGVIRMPDRDCAAHEIVVSMPDDLPITFCVSRYTGVLRYLERGRCSASEWSLRFPDDGPINVCVSKYTHVARYSRTASGCRSYERHYLLGEVAVPASR